MEGLIRALARVEAELRDLLQAVHQHLVSNQHTEPPKLAELLADHKHAFDLKITRPRHASHVPNKRIRSHETEHTTTKTCL